MVGLDAHGIKPSTVATPCIIYNNHSNQKSFSLH